MNIEQIQQRIDAISKGMSAKGLSRPVVSASNRSHESCSVYLAWNVSAAREAASKYEVPTGVDMPAQLDAADAWVASLPSINELRKAQFMSGLAELIELGNAAGIECDLVNPLMAAMKKLSENALTDQSVAP